MRYIKVLILAVCIFLALIFFFQNQIALSQQMALTLNLFFIPPMTSIPLPFYFIVVCAFFLGCLLSLSLLVWDKFSMSARVMKNKWRISTLERQVDSLKQQLGSEEKTVDAVAQAENIHPKVDISKKPAEEKEKA